MSVFKLRGKTQNYAWGKLGSDSMVARLMKNANEDFIIDPQKTYAELWMGTHPSAPSEIMEGESAGMALSDWLSAHPDASGKAGSSPQLPYLLKILSIQKALSIQAHPNKTHAEVLFKQLPDKYPDDNHKPEMAIALTPFEALCGFRPLSDIQTFIRDVPELREAVGEESAQNLLDQKDDGEAKNALKRCFTDLMSSGRYQALLQRLEERMKSETQLGVVDGEMRELFLRLCNQFPGDVGCFGIFLFNVLRLSPGQAIYLAANEPHAYLSGDCVECMACSDNVVRAGLTPKWKDVATLCEMLTYKMRSKEENLFFPTPDPSDPHLLHFRPPVKDFAITKIQVTGATSDYSPAAVAGASLLLTTEGAADYQDGDKQGRAKPGTVLFLSAGARITLNVSENVTIFQAYEQ